MKYLNKYLFELQEGFWFPDKTISVDLHKFESGEKDKLLIIGFTGSGKSTLGRKLAKKYNCKYFELDECDRKKDYVKCCYVAIKTSKEKMVVEGVGIINSYFIDYKNLKQFILEQPIIFLGKSQLYSGIKAFIRDFNRDEEVLSNLRKMAKYNPNLSLGVKFKNLVEMFGTFRKERISQKGSVVKLFKV